MSECFSLSKVEVSQRTIEEDEDDKKAEKPLDAKADAKAEKPYPNLGSVPARPKRPTPEEQAKKISEGLIADTEHARYTDQQ